VPQAIRAHPAPSHEADERARVGDAASALVVHASKWIGFLAGLTLLVAVALIPPAADLDAIRLQRDRLLALEQTDLARLANYQALIDAIDEKDPDTVRLVLASQLQLVPRGSTALVAPGQPDDPRLFEILEPEPTPVQASPPSVPSTLARMANDRKGRFVLLAIASLGLLWGLMPPLTEPA
jgi:hypothetical protein